MRKRLFYLTNNELTAYTWSNSRLSLDEPFANDEAGWDAFSTYLSSTDNVPAYLFVDLVEEDFQRDTIPHVMGKAKRMLIERRLSQLYRDTPFRQVSFQGREKLGRKDDRVLFSALTNPALAKPWLDVISKRKVPLIGIFSAALLSVFLIKKLGLRSGAILLVSHQSSGLRQSYFQDGFLRFSRLTPVPSADREIAEAFFSDTAKTRQFLGNSRLLGRDEKIQIVTLARTSTLEDIRKTSEDTSAVTYRLIDFENKERLFGIRNLATGTGCDAFFLSLLAKTNVASHYPSKEQAHYYQLWKAKLALHLLSVAMVFAALVWSGSNLLEFMEHRSNTEQFNSEAQRLIKEYEATVRNMPVTLVNPHEMKSVVDIETAVQKNAPTPVTMAVIISRALNDLPQIKIDRLHWLVNDPSVVAEPGNSGVQAQVKDGLSETLPVVGILGLSSQPIQVAILEGEVVPFNQDYRIALKAVQQLAAAISKNKQLKVDITLQPLDTSPTAVLEGSAGSGIVKASARFAMTITWTP